MKGIIVLAVTVMFLSCAGDGNNTDAASEDSIGGIQLDTNNMIKKTEADPMHLEKDSLKDSNISIQPVSQ